MNGNRITQEQIDALLNGAELRIETVFGKCTVATARLKSGFVLSEMSACVDPENYDGYLGEQLCRERLKTRLWELEGYALQKRLGLTSGLSFGAALDALKRGGKLYRRGWNGKGIYIALQQPDAHSKMTSPYIYIDTTGLRSDNPDAPRSRVPWLASQTDMLAEDWEACDES